MAVGMESPASEIYEKTTAHIMTSLSFTSVKDHSTEGIKRVQLSNKVQSAGCCPHFKNV